MFLITYLSRFVPYLHVQVCLKSPNPPSSSKREWDEIGINWKRTGRAEGGIRENWGREAGGKKDGGGISKLARTEENRRKVPKIACYIAIE